MSPPCRFEDTAVLGPSCGAGFALFMSLVEAVLRSRCDVSDACRRAGRDAARVLRDGDAADYVVVGAGVAGPVVAARLAEEPGVSVLLLEAGPEEPTSTQVPCFATHAVGTSLDWNFTTTRQEGACLATGGVCRWPRGKMVAGTGGMHGMMYTRGHRGCYDGWARAGNPGWRYDDVLPYFKKAERNLNPDQMEMEFHGAEGAMPVQQFPHRPAMSEVIVAALQSMGYRRGDLNGANQTGVNVAQMMVEGGLRASTARVYLRPLHNSTRLRVAIGAHVTRVLIDPASRRARGVEYVDGAGATKRALARREVILSAGAIGSPQLLMLSGVGPSEHLTALGIKTVRDLPVGENLHNHVSAGLGFWVRSPGPGRRALNADTLDAFLRTRGGPMASTGLTQTTAFVLSQYAKDGVPDLQMFFDGYSARCSRAGEPGECESDSCGPAYVLARPTARRPAGAAAARPALPVAAARPRRAGRRAAAGGARRRHAAHARLGRRRRRRAAPRLPAPALRLRPVLALRRARPHRAREPPGRHVQDGPLVGLHGRGGRPAARPRRGRAARRRRLHLPGGAQRQPRGAHHHGGREGRRHDQGGLAARAPALASGQSLLPLPFQSLPSSQGSSDSSRSPSPSPSPLPVGTVLSRQFR